MKDLKPGIMCVLQIPRKNVSTLKSNGDGDVIVLKPIVMSFKEPGRELRNGKKRSDSLHNSTHLSPEN
jgi:hypothetical protein